MAVIAFDLETFLIERWRPLPFMVCLSWCDGMNSAVIPHGDSVQEWLIAKLDDPDVHFVGHNVAYDFGCVASSYPYLLPRVFAAYKAGRVTDTGIRQQLFDIATGRTFADDKVKYYSLAALYKLCFDKDMPGGPKSKISEEPDYVRYKFGNLYYVEFSDWPDEYLEYARNDAVCTFEIWQEQCKAAHLLRDDAFQTYSAFCLSLIQAYGMRTDAGVVRTFKAEQTAIIEYLRPRLIEAGLLEPEYRGRGTEKHIVGWTKKIKPAQDRIAKVCEEKNISPIMTTPKNPNTPPQIATDRAACHWCEDPLMLDRAEYATAEKMLSTYVPFLEKGADGPITSRFNLAATGRTTSSTPRPPAEGGNQQNAPRKTKRVDRDKDKLVDSEVGVRECFVPRKKRIYLRGDLEGAELHGLAQVCKNRVGYSVLGEVLKAGRDAHVYTSCYLLGGDGNDYDDVLLRYKQDDPEAGEARQNSKPANFGFGGYMGVPTFILTQLKVGKKWSKEDATRVRQAWFAAYPEMNEYFQGNKIELGPKNITIIEFLWSKRLRKVRGLPMISNNLFQALVGDGAKKACNEVIRLCYIGGPESPLWANETRPCNFIHDELVTETNDDTPAALHPVVTEFKTTLEAEFNELVPDYPTSVDVVLSYSLSKRAKAVYDDNGYLKPWLGLDF